MASCFFTYHMQRVNISYRVWMFPAKVWIMIYWVLGILVLLKVFHAFKSEKMYLVRVLNMKIGLLVVLVVRFEHSDPTFIGIEWRGHTADNGSLREDDLTYSATYIWSLCTYVVHHVATPTNNKSLQIRWTLFHTMYNH